MSRPLRIEFPGAIYHVPPRGDRRETIFEDDVDRQALLDVLAQRAGRFDAQVLAYCLVRNPYHFVLHARAANLSCLMWYVNGTRPRVLIGGTARWGIRFKGGSTRFWLTESFKS